MSLIIKILNRIGWNTLSILLTTVALYNVQFIADTVCILDKGHIATENTKYLQAAESDASEMLLVLNGTKAVISVLETSTAGISFIVEAKMQVGKAVNAFQTTLDYAITGSLFSLTGLVVIDLLLDIAKIFSTQLIKITIIFVGLHFTFKGHVSIFDRITSKLAIFATMITLLAQFFLPLSIYSTNIIANDITGKTRKSTHRTLQTTHELLKPITNTDNKIDEHVKSTVHNAHQISKDISDRNHLVSKSVVKYLVCIVFEVLIIPIAVIFLLLFISRTLISNIIVTNNFR